MSRIRLLESCSKCGEDCNDQGVCEDCELVSEEITESSEFDKFMDNILIKEHKSKKLMLQKIHHNVSWQSVIENYLKTEQGLTRDEYAH